jgi:hypothetical protein
MVTKEMMSMEAKGQLGVALAASSLLSQSLDPFCVFSISMSPCHEIARGRVYIVGFRSRRFRRAKFCSNRTHRVEVGPHHVA